MAIREIRKNAAGQYLIIGGVYPPSGFGKVIEQALFSWTGERGDQPVRLTTPMPQSTEEFDEDPPAWEGIGQMPANLTVGSQVRLIMDNGESRPYLPDEHTKSKQMTDHAVAEVPYRPVHADRQGRRRGHRPPRRRSRPRRRTRSAPGSG